MKAVEFITQLNDSPTLAIPANVAAQLPKSGRVRVLVLTDDPDEADWRAGAYEQFIRDDSPEDAIYERGYAAVPEDVSLPTAMLPHLAADAEKWE